MKNKKIIIIISVSILVIFIFGIRYYQKALVNFGFGDNLNSANLYAKDVTMVQLIATPERYDGKFIRVIGVGNLEFENNCLSLSKEDLKYGVGNSIWLELGDKAISYEEAKQYNGEYVIVEGFFDKDDRGHMDMFCGSIKDISRYDLWVENKFYDITESYSITKNEDLTYSYEITDKNGKVLLYDNSAREPKIEQVNTNVLGVSIQTGTGLSTNWAIYCDVEKSQISETFNYVLGAQGDYVIYANLENSKHSIVVQNIFDKTAYYKTHILEDASSVAADVVVDFKLKGEDRAIVTYLSGEKYTKTDITIYFP
ncbi:MAG: hypothetical protein E7416_05425 [Ruminococcaceae bacterium]|nr:hypothetical protein [Oscillospiraceae bacterium]